MQFDMNRTWERAIRLVRKNFQLLAVIAGVFMLLPAVLIYVAFPDMLALMSVSADPAEMEAQMRAVMPQLMTVGMLTLLLQMIGYMAMVALIGSDRPTVGESIVRGIKGLPSLIAAGIVFGAGYLVITLVLGLIIGLIASLLGMASEGAAAGLGFVLSIFLVSLVLYAMTRFSLTMPAIVLERLGPLKSLARSWRLTKPRAGAIFGFFALLIIAYMVVSILLFIVIGAFGFVAGGAGGGSALALGLLSGLMGSAAAMLLSGILVSMHEQLTGGDALPREVEADG